MANCTLHVMSQISSGKIFKCLTCDKFHIEYKNLNFVFSKAEFENFRDYFLKLDAEYWECLNKDTFYNRKIMVPIGHRNFTALFNIEEIYELKSLFLSIQQHKQNNEFLNTKNIEARLSIN